MTPADTAKAYLEALSSGDAARALSFGNAQPANTDLLTDEVLHEQLAKMPISNIRILDVDKSMESIGTSMVHVAVNFGQVVDDVRLELTLGADKKTWKLTTAAIKVDPPLGSDMNKAEQTVTIFGKNFKNGSLYIFPGYLDVSSSNDYLTATAQPLLLDHLQTYMSASLDPDVNLNADGRKAINDELVAAFARCQGSNQLAPPGCPAKVGFNDAVDGTLTWGSADLSGVTIGDLSAFDLTVLVAGSADFPLSYRTTSGDTKQGTATAYLGGSADISQHPPRLNLR